MAKILGELTYARHIPTYVEAPFQVMESTLQKLEDRYYTNRDNADKFEIMMSNIDVNKKDQFIKDTTIIAIQNTFNKIREKGDWENASLVIRDMAKNFAMNEPLRMAMKNQQKKAIGKVMLQKGVDEGTYTQSDMNRELLNAETRYEGVSIDEYGGASGSYNIQPPPKWFNIQKEVMDIVKGWKPDTIIPEIEINGKRIKMKSPGDFVLITPTIDSQGNADYNGIVSEESISETEVYQAISDIVRLNEFYMDRKTWEDSPNIKSFEDLDAIGIDKIKMVEDLVNLGQNKGQIDKLSNEDLAAFYQMELSISKEAIPAMLQLGYSNRKYQNLGISREREAYNNKVRNTGNDETVELMSRGSFSRTGRIKSTRIANSIEKYDEMAENDESVIQSMNKTLTDYTNEITGIQAKTNLSKADENKIKELQAEYARINASKKQYQFGMEITKSAVRDAINDYNRDNKDSKDIYAFEKRAVAKQEYEPISLKMTKAISQYRKDNDLVSTNAGKGDFRIDNSQLVGSLANETMMKKLSQTRDKNGNFYVTGEEYNKYLAYTDYYGVGKNPNAIDEEWADDLQPYIDQRVADSSYDLGFIDISTSGTYSKDATQVLRNSPHLFTAQTSNMDEPMSIQSDDLNDFIDMDAVEVIGPAYEASPVHGYPYVAIERQRYKKGNKKGEVIPGSVKQQVYLYPINGQDPLREMTNIESSKVQGIKENKAFKGMSTAQNPVMTLKAKQDIDLQLADFNAFPERTPSEIGSDTQYAEVTHNVVLDPLTFAKVTRQIDDRGNKKFVVQYNQLEDNGVQYNPPPVTYSSIMQVQLDMEKMVGSDLEVPISSLEVAGVGSYTNIQFKRGVNHYFAKPMVKSLKLLDAAYNKSIIVTSGTRSEEANALLKLSAEDSMHLYGLALDLRYDDDLVAFLESKVESTETSGYKAIPSLGLKYFVHGDGDEKHIHAVSLGDRDELISSLLNF